MKTVCLKIETSILFFVLFVTADFSAFPQEQKIPSFQSIVDAMASLIAKQDLPEYLYETALRKGDEFDANKYFSIINHLSMQPGYILDWVYYSDPRQYGQQKPYAHFGQPVLYARLESDASFASFSEYVESMGKSIDQLRYQFLDHIQIDGTPEGYFQFVVLAMMGDIFYFCIGIHFIMTK